MSIAEALNATIAALDPAEVDAAAVELARLYARQLDQAAAVAARADRVAREARNRDDEGFLEEIEALRAKLGEKECVDRIGARFHALLAELQATPKARGNTKPAGAAGGTLHRLRAAR